MGFFDLFRKKEEVRSTTVAADALVEALGGGDMTPMLALSIPVVSACVSYIANVLSSLPVRMYDDEKEIEDDYRLDMLNVDSGDLLDSREICKAMVRDYLLNGSGYCYVDWKGNTVKAIKYIKPTYVSSAKFDNPIDKVVKWSIQGKAIPDYKMMRLLRYTQDGIRGIGIPIEIAPELDTYLSALKYAKRVYATGGARGIVQASERLTQDAINELKKAWSSLYSEDDSKVIILNKGLTYQSIGNTVADNELSETLDRAEKDICAAFGLNSKLIDGGMSEQDAMQVVECCIAPIATALSNMYTRYLLLETEKEAGIKIKVDIDALTNGNLLNRYQAHAIAISNGIKSISEVRHEEGLPNLDVPYLKLGLADVLLNTETGTIYTPNTDSTMDIDEKMSEKEVKDDGNQT